MTFTQMTSTSGIKKHLEKAVADIYKEYKQLESMKEMGALKPDSLTISQKKGALRTINPIKEKCSRTLKGRTPPMHMKE